MSMLAERQGFEPWKGVTLNGFQDRRIQPLCHLSELVDIIRRNIEIVTYFLLQ